MPAETKVQTQAEADEKMVDIPSEGSSVDVEIKDTPTAVTSESDETIEERGYTTVTGLVLKVGPDAYKDKERFSNGPWCKKNDWIIFGRYAGSRFGIEGGEVRILNDDEIIAVVKDPEDILQYK